MSTLLNKAHKVAKFAHEGQVDKGGKPYIAHPLAVADMVSEELEKVVALLHDVVEDTPVTLEELQRYFPSDVCNAIHLLTKKNDEDYCAYLARIKENPLARAVKIADMTHNSDLSRIKNPKKEDFLRVEKYACGIRFLSEE